MIRFWIFFSVLCWADPSYALYPWSSPWAYQEYKIKKRDFEQNQSIFLTQQRIRTMIFRFQKNERAYLLEFYSQMDKNRDQKNQKALKTPSELAYLKHQNRNQAVENLRTQAFLEYKKNYQSYQKKQQQILSSRLKKLKAVRQQAPFTAPIF